MNYCAVPFSYKSSLKFCPLLLMKFIVFGDLNTGAYGLFPGGIWVYYNVQWICPHGTSVKEEGTIVF